MTHTTKVTLLHVMAIACFTCAITSIFNFVPLSWGAPLTMSGWVFVVLAVTIHAINKRSDKRSDKRHPPEEP